MLGSGLWGVCTLVSRYFCISGIVIIIILCIGLVVHVCVRVRAQLLSCVQLLVVPWTVAHQAPLSVGFSRQEYWCELSFPTSGDLPDPGIKPTSLNIGRQILYHWTTREALKKKLTVSVTSRYKLSGKYSNFGTPLPNTMNLTVSRCVEFSVNVGSDINKCDYWL